MPTIVGDPDPFAAVGDALRSGRVRRGDRLHPSARSLALAPPQPAAPPTADHGPTRHSMSPPTRGPARPAPEPRVPLAGDALLSSVVGAAAAVSAPPQPPVLRGLGRRVDGRRCGSVRVRGARLVVRGGWRASWLGPGTACRGSAIAGVGPRRLRRRLRLRPGGASASPAEIGCEARPICWLARRLAAIDTAAAISHAEQGESDPATSAGV